MEAVAERSIPLFYLYMDGLEAQNLAAQPGA